MKNLSNNIPALSSSFLQSTSVEALRECKQCGINTLELSIGGICPSLENALIQEHWLKLIDSACKNDMKLWSAHLSFWEPYDIASMDTTLREQAIERQLDMIHFVHKNTDIKTFVIHPSFEPIMPENRFAQMQHAKNSLRILTDEAEHFGAQIAVECLPRTCLGNNIDSMAKLLSSDSRLRICFDTNHLLTDTNEDFIKALGDKIITIHVSDYDRVDERHIMPYEGINNWKMIFSLLLASGYNGPVLFELRTDKGYNFTDIKDCYDRLCREF